MLYSEYINLYKITLKKKILQLSTPIPLQQYFHYKTTAAGPSKESTQVNVLFIRIVENVVNIVFNLVKLPEYWMLQLLVLFFYHLIEKRCTRRQSCGSVLWFNDFRFRRFWLDSFLLFLLWARCLRNQL